jgi:hypothetical protein
VDKAPIEQKGDVPGPLPWLPRDAPSPEAPQDEQAERHKIDWVIDAADGPPEVREEAQSKVTRLEDHRRKDRSGNNPHGWMG